MTNLATADDVAVALGLANAAALSAAQALRVPGLLARASREFRREAERVFTPGTTTVRLLTVAGRVHLADPVADVDAVASVSMRDCDPVDLEYTLDGQTLLLEHNGYGLPSGVEVTVTYTTVATVPADVVAAVAEIVARNLSTTPADAGVMSESAGPFTRRFADWVSKTSLLTEEDCEIARSYRYPGSTVIIQRP